MKFKEIDFNPFQEVDQQIPLNDAQKEVWLSCAIGGRDANLSFNESVYLKLTGTLHVQAMEKAILGVVDRHSALRCKLSGNEGSLIVEEQETGILEFEDFSKLPTLQKQEALEKKITQQWELAFDLEKGPLSRFVLIKWEEQVHYLHLCFHQLIADPASIKILLEEISEGYSALLTTGSLPEKTVSQMTDYNLTYSTFKESPKYLQNNEYWFTLYQNQAPQTNLKTDLPRPPLKTYQGDSILQQVSKETVEKITALAAELKVTPFSVIYSCFELFLCKRSGQSELVIGLLTEGRSLSQTEGIVGSFQQTLPIRTRYEKPLSFNQFVQERANVLKSAKQHELFSLRTLLDSIPRGSDGSQSSFLPIAFSWKNTYDRDLRFQDLTHELLVQPRKYEGFDLAVTWVDGSAPYMEWSYNKDLYHKSTIQNMTEQFLYLLRSALENPTQSLKEIHLEDPIHYLKKVKEWNQTHSPFSKEQTLLDLFEKQSLANPHKTAILFYGETTSYERLFQESNQLAHYLIEKGIQKNDCIGIALSRSPFVIQAMLAVLSCGATFLPIDPEFPADRIRYMLEDSAVKTVITEQRFQGAYAPPEKELILESLGSSLSNYPTHRPDYLASEGDRAYILYTSGSTGKPKGVQIGHSALLNFLLSMQKAPGVGPEDNFLATTTVSFDISILEIFTPLISGAQITLLDEKDNRNGKAILDSVVNNGVTIIQGGPAFYTLILYEGWSEKLPVKVLCGGEAFPKALADELLEKAAEVWNMYGPTETTIWSTVKKLSKEDPIITVGRPIDNTQVYLVDEDLQLVAQGQEGEIYIAGEGLALGYLNQPELTKEKFIPNPFASGSDEKMYGTGDMGIRLPNGEIQCLGRMDHQVKIRGVRIELGEIEHELKNLEGVQEAVVTLLGEDISDKSLAAYLITTKEVKEETFNEWVTKWKAQLKHILPQFMLPLHYVRMVKFPLTPNGKLDRKALPVPSRTQKERNTPYVAPVTVVERQLAALWAKLLKTEKVGTEDHFFEIGGNSLLAVLTMSALKKEHGYDLPVTKLYQHTTIKRLAACIEREQKEKNKETNPFAEAQQNNAQNETQSSMQEIAVIAMSGRFPKANSVDEFWNLLISGEEGTSFFNREELDPSISEEEKNDPSYVAARGHIEGVEDFDAPFFGIPPKLAEVMDPQQRVFLEICWEALEESGYNAEQYQGKVGVFAGCAKSYYFLNQVQHYPNLIRNIGDLQVGLVNEKDYLATRVAYSLDLKGPAVTVQSACSTSLLAVAQAVESLRSGKCDVALAGGASIMTPIKSGYIYQEGSMLSKDGHCRPFDSQAAGTVFSDGAGVVLLKPLEAAIRDGDTVYACIKGIGVNNDGSDKSSFFAPSSDGQAGAIRMAFEDARIEASSISYVEAHGTATPLGDPIEIEGLTRAFNAKGKGQFCAIGSVKSNIGHLNTAAGIAGFIKTCLSLYHKRIPATLHFQSPNPHINFKETPFFVNDCLTPWELPAGQTKRRAGVSSFGVGGTNVHVILEDVAPLSKNQIKARGPVLINWSAKNEKSKKQYAAKLLDFVKAHPQMPIQEFAYSLHATRSSFTNRSFLVAKDREDFITQMEKGIPSSQEWDLKEQFPENIFLFPGQGAQYLQMGKQLYEHEPYFAQQVDECVALLTPILGENILSVVFADESAEALAKFNNTYYTQPALFVIEYALAKLLISWGIQPQALIGHSIGEFVAGHLAGIFSLKDALYLISMRGKLMADLPAGKMLAVRVSEEELIKILPPELSIAASNSLLLNVVAGPIEKIEEFALRLKDKGIVSAPLAASHAFHSSMMDSVVEPFKKIVEKISLKKPSLPILSTVTGTWLTAELAQDPAYWAAHLRETVKFSKAAKAMLEHSKGVYIECGPKNVLSNLLKQQGYSGVVSIPLLAPQKGQAEPEAITHALGQLWLQGRKFSLSNYYGQNKGIIWRLPSYAFAKKKLWLEVPAKEKALYSL